MLNFTKVKTHLENHKRFYLTMGYAAATAILLDPSIALADIGTGGMRIYTKLTSVAKWVIIIKGSIDVIQSVLNGDFQLAKRSFFSYILCFAIILSLPWCLTEIEGVFK